MRTLKVLLAVAPGVFLCANAVGDKLLDVPANHWARTAVVAVVDRGVMDAPRGKFDGGKLVTQTEMVVIMDKLAHSFESGKWKSVKPVNVKDQPKEKSRLKDGVTRYELASIIYRLAPAVVKGMPKTTGKIFGESSALPDKVDIMDVPENHPAYKSLLYLAKRRMIIFGSPLLTPSSRSVTAAEARDGLTTVIVGLTDQLTEEPQLRDDSLPRPANNGKDEHPKQGTTEPAGK